VSKRKRGEQQEPAVPCTSETRLLPPPPPLSSPPPPPLFPPPPPPPAPPPAGASQSLIHHARSFLPFVPESLYHPPFSVEFLEIYNDLCQCESSLNASSTFNEIQDVLADCQLLYSRISDERHCTLVLLDRTQDLETNIRLKFFRCCHRVIRHAAQMADDIETFRYVKVVPMQAPSSSDVEAILRTTDDLAASLYAELEPLKLLYFQEIRPILVSYWEDESSSDDEYDSALSEALERELHPPE
jgi:hypothetical protein